MRKRFIQALILLTFLVLFLFNTKHTEKPQRVSNDSLYCDELCLSAGFGDLLDEVDKIINNN